MKYKKSAIAFLVSLCLIVVLLPKSVYAQNSEVSVHIPEGDNLTMLDQVMISGVEEPVSGQTLDGSAEVTTGSDVTWTIHVFWVDSEFESTDEYQEGLSPILAFYVPAGYTIDGTVTLDAYLTSVFNRIGHAESNYDEATGYTFIFGVKNVVWSGVSGWISGSGTGYAAAKEDAPSDYDDDPEWDPDDDLELDDSDEIVEGDDTAMSLR